MTPSPFTTYADTVCQSLKNATQRERKAIRQELEDHLTDHAEALIESGWDEAHATQHALDAMGDPQEVGQELSKAFPLHWFVLSRLALAAFAALLLTVSWFPRLEKYLKDRSNHFEVHLELWKEGQEYDRLGLTDQYTQIMGVNIPRLLLPIHPGRNIAAVLEVAASNFRLKQMGYNAAEVLTQRHMQRAMREDNDEA